MPQHNIPLLLSRRPRIEQLEKRCVLSAVPQLVDVNTIGEDAEPKFFVEANSLAFYSANDLEGPSRLWRTDGTVEGTFKITDFPVNLSATSFLRPGPPTEVNGVLYFIGMDSENGTSLWKSDGTVAGTELVFDPDPNSTSGLFNGFTNVDGTLYFMESWRLYKSDGTTAGTEFIKYFNSPGVLPTQFTSFNGALYLASNGPTGHEIWKSDGTADGTQPITNMSLADPKFNSLTVVGNTLFFTANSGAGIELWKSDGSVAGTVQVKDIRTGGLGSSPSRLTNVNGELFFSANNGSAGEELWKSDGSAAGTLMVKDLRPGNGVGSTPLRLTNVAGTLYFYANDGSTGYEFWKSDGTAAGTVRITDLNLRDVRAGWPEDDRLAVIGSTFFFMGWDDAAGAELWRSDGTAAGTYRISNIGPGALNATTPHGDGSSYLTAVGQTLYLRANDGLTGNELWRSDGTAAGTSLVIDAHLGTLEGFSSSEPGPVFTNVNGVLYFIARMPLPPPYVGSSGSQVWRTDGTPEGTRLAFTLPSTPYNLTSVNGLLAFICDDQVSGGELWVSDGTQQGTYRTSNINPDNSYNASAPSNLTEANGNLYFVANDGATGPELYVRYPSGGIYRISNLTSLYYEPVPSSLVNVGGAIYFTVNVTGGSTTALWRSEGTTATTKFVRSFDKIDGMVAVGDELYLKATSYPYGSELWRVEGKLANLVADLSPGSADSDIRNLTNVNGRLYFTVGNFQVLGYEPWTTDGTPAGTRRVSDDTIRVDLADAGSMFNIGDILYFSAKDELTGSELWRSDGTTAGTYLVADLTPGPASTIFYGLTRLADLFFFTNLAGTWQSDGTAAGTRLVSELQGYRFGLSSEGLAFVADDGIHGDELWLLDLTSPGDYDRNYKVDGADFLTWQRQFGSAPTIAGKGADGDASGTVDSADIELWKEYFGAPATLPEITASSAVAQTAALVASDEATTSIVPASSFASLRLPRDAFLSLPPAMSRSSVATSPSRNRLDAIPQPIREAAFAASAQNQQFSFVEIDLPKANRLKSPLAALPDDASSLADEAFGIDFDGLTLAGVR